MDQNYYLLKNERKLFCYKLERYYYEKQKLESIQVFY